MTSPIETEIPEAERRLVRDRRASAQTLVSAEEAVRNALVSPAALAADAAAGFMLGRAGRGAAIFGVALRLRQTGLAR